MNNIKAENGERMLLKKSKKKNQGGKANKGKRGGTFQFLYKTFFNVPAWIGFKQIRESNKVIVDYVKDSFSVNEAERNESFEEALTRLNISNEALQQTYKSNTRNFYIMAVVVTLLVVYAIYLLTSGAYKALLVDLAVIVLASVRLFQFSFWNFQIKHRKLGCSVKEWYSRKICK